MRFGWAFWYSRYCEFYLKTLSALYRIPSRPLCNSDRNLTWRMFQYKAHGWACPNICLTLFSPFTTIWNSRLQHVLKDTTTYTGQNGAELNIDSLISVKNPSKCWRFTDASAPLSSFRGLSYKEKNKREKGKKKKERRQSKKRHINITLYTNCKSSCVHWKKPHDGFNSW